MTTYFRMPRFEVIIEENAVPVRFVKLLTADELTVMIKDKFINWRELVNIHT